MEIYKSVIEFVPPHRQVEKPSEHNALDKKLTRDGFITKSLMERFPHGLDWPVKNPALEMQWGVQIWEFLSSLLATDRELHDHHRKITRHKELLNDEVRIMLRDMKEERWRDYLIGLLAYFKNALRLEQFYAHREMVMMHFRRVLIRENFIQKWFITRIIDGLEADKARVHRVQVELKNNRNNTSMSWPEEKNHFDFQRIAEDRMSAMYLRIKLDRALHDHAEMKLKIDAMKERLAAAEMSWKYGLKIETRALIDKRPGRARWGMDAVNGIFLAKV